MGQHGGLCHDDADDPSPRPHAGRAPTRWKATGYVDGVGWLDAWGTSLIAAMEALQALAAQRVAGQALPDADGDGGHGHGGGGGV
jgi:hypothetical protein